MSDSDNIYGCNNTKPSKCIICGCDVQIKKQAQHKYTKCKKCIDEEKLKRKEEKRKKLSESLKGENNPNFGKKWMYNPYTKINKRFPKDTPETDEWKNGAKQGNGYNHKEQINHKTGISLSVELEERKAEYYKNPKKCPICSTIISYEKRRNTTCSVECKNNLFSQRVKSNEIKITSGGYRKNSGRSYKGYYKGIWCQSTYELCWVIYALDHNINFKRFDGIITDGNLTYIPDYILDDNKTIIELKGYEDKESVNAKTKLAESFGYDVKVLYKEDLTDVFEYVKLTYNTNDFKTLFDGYKPKHKYVCDSCNKIFYRDRKIKTEIKFCCRECSGRGIQKLFK